MQSLTKRKKKSGKKTVYTLLSRVKFSQANKSREGQRSGTGIFVFLVLSMSTDSAGPPKNDTDKKLH